MINFYWTRVLLFCGVLFWTSLLTAEISEKIDTLPQVIQSAQIGYMKTPDGRDIRYALWKSTQSKKNQAILILQGRASFIEKHSELIQDLIARGYEVFTLDLVGQGHSTRLLNHPQKGHITSYDMYINDIHQLIHEIIQKISSKPLVLFGSSMGGHIALRYLETYPEDSMAAVLESPMLDIPTDPFPRWAAKALAYGGTWLGMGDRYAPGYGDFDPSKDVFEKSNNTRDKNRFLRQRQYALDYPNHVIGGPTIGWVKATFDSISTLQDLKNLVKIKVPVLLLNAGQDKSVLNHKDDEICKSLSKCRLITYKDSFHHIVVERPEIRDQFWIDFSDFMNTLETHQKASFAFMEASH